MSDLLAVTDANFNEEVFKSDLPVVVDFWAPWCGPCRMLAPKLDEAAKVFEGRCKIVKYNCDDSSDIAAQYNIRSIPCLLVFKNGEVVNEHMGSCDQATLNAFIEKSL